MRYDVVLFSRPEFIEFFAVNMIPAVKMSVTPPLASSSSNNSKHENHHPGATTASTKDDADQRSTPVGVVERISIDDIYCSGTK
jgi:hypothetical protein